MSHRIPSATVLATQLNHDFRFADQQGINTPQGIISFLPLLVFLALTPSASASGWGAEDCPCLNISHLSSMLVTRNTNNNTNTYLSVDVVVGNTSSGYGTYESQACQLAAVETFHLPQTYGMNGCAAYDENSEPYCRGSDEPYCDIDWCYVNATQCHASNWSYAQSDLVCGLFYSYETCAGKNLEEEDEPTYLLLGISSALQGASLRVGVPALFYPDHYRINATTDEPIYYDDNIFAGDGDLQGMYIEFLEDVASEANFDIEYVSVSGGSVGESSSRWTACVRDVMKGLVDVCVGNFWETSERRSMAQFTAPIFDDSMIFITHKPVIDDSISTVSKRIFEPFSSELWGTIVGASALVGVVYVSLDTKREIWKAFSGEREFWEDRTVLQGVLLILRRVVNFCYVAMLELLSGAPRDDDEDARSIPQKFISLGWGFFIVIILAAYTANLAAFLTLSSVNWEYSSFTDCISRDCTMCLTTSQAAVLSQQLTSRYGTFQYKVLGTYQDVAESIVKGQCHAGIISEQTFRADEELWKNCKLVLAGGPIVALPVGWPVNSNYATSLSYWMTTAKESGDWTTISAEYVPNQQCNIWYEEEESSDTTKLGVTEMMGPLLILGVTAVVSVCVQAARMGALLAIERWFSGVLEYGRQSVVGGTRQSEIGISLWNFKGGDEMSSQSSLGSRSSAMSNNPLRSGQLSQHISLSLMKQRPDLAGTLARGEELRDGLTALLLEMQSLLSETQPPTSKQDEKAESGNEQRITETTHLPIMSDI